MSNSENDLPGTVLQYRLKHYKSIKNGLQPYRDTHSMHYMHYRKDLKIFKSAYPAYLKFLGSRIKRDKKLAALMPNIEAPLNNLSSGWLKLYIFNRSKNNQAREASAPAWIFLKAHSFNLFRISSI